MMSHNNYSNQNQWQSSYRMNHQYQPNVNCQYNNWGYVNNGQQYYNQNGGAQNFNSYYQQQQQQQFNTHQFVMNGVQVPVQQPYQPQRQLQNNQKQVSHAEFYPQQQQVLPEVSNNQGGMESLPKVFSVTTNPEEESLIPVIHLQQQVVPVTVPKQESIPELLQYFEENVGNFGNMILENLTSDIAEENPVDILCNEILSQGTPESLEEIDTNELEQYLIVLSPTQPPLDGIQGPAKRGRKKGSTGGGSRKDKCTCPNCISGYNKQPGVKKVHTCHLENCPKKYSTTSHLRAHILTHEGIRPYGCNQPGCEKRFTRSDELARHIRTHIGSRDYECQLCGKKFHRSDHLSKHLKAHSAVRKVSKPRGKAAPKEQEVPQIINIKMENDGSWSFYL